MFKRNSEFGPVPYHTPELEASLRCSEHCHDAVEKERVFIHLATPIIQLAKSHWQMRVSIHILQERFGNENQLIFKHLRDMFSSFKTIRPRLRICITPFRLRSFIALITPIIVSRLPVHNVRTSKETFKIYSNFFIILLILISVLPVSTVTLMHPPSHLLPVLVACEDPGCRFQPKLFDICTKTHGLVYSLRNVAARMGTMLIYM